MMMMWLTTNVGKSWILRGNLVCGLGETLCDFVEGCVCVLTLDSAELSELANEISYVISLSIYVRPCSFDTHSKLD